MEEQIKEVASRQILRAFEEKEAQLDQQINQLENMDEDDFEILRQKRKEQLKKQFQQRQRNLRNDHGVYTELANQEDFFEAVKKSMKMCVHFYRSSTFRCQIVDSHFERLAQKYIGTRFCKIDAEKAPFLCQRLGIYVMPTILLIKDHETIHQMRGFEELGGMDEFSDELLAWAISQHSNVIQYEGDPPREFDENNGNSLNLMRGGISEGYNVGELDDDPDLYA